MAARKVSDNVVVKVTETDTLSRTKRRREQVAILNGAGGNGVVKGGRVSSAGVDARVVPVSLPVGTLISGSTFNVITPDQLPHFKPMLCVDNGFISGGGGGVSAGEEVKTHIVIQNEKPAPEKVGALHPRSWADTVHMPVLPVRCKNTSAELHKNKFGSGGRGKCIKYGVEWYTPSEFEALCGRASSKDWKRSIRFGGRSIQALIDEGILTPHATSCTCGACCDDHSAMGPIRLFTPYKRKRRNILPDIIEKKPKIKRDSSLGESDVDNIHQTSSGSHTKEAWQSIADGLNEANNGYQLLGDTLEDSTDQSSAFPDIPDLTAVMKRLEDISATLVRLGSELKQCVEDVGVLNARHVGQVRASDLLTAGVEAEHAPLHAVEVTETKKCANCNREAAAECSLCRRTPYCSTYCQKKDWASHQIECLRTVPTIHADSHQHQSIMLIVESQHQ